ncbi:MAG: CDP-glycerol glycerophosphotransferase family protein [Cyclobacteriaceae bacterium]|nr:CDP-glycerol glycerophosphotransferase family protein [Cyclobacteriaceae bacterium]
MPHLTKYTDVEIWATSMRSNADAWKRLETLCSVKPFPQLPVPRQFPWLYLKRIAEFAFDFENKLPSRFGIWKNVYCKNASIQIKFLRIIGQLLYRLKIHRILARFVENEQRRRRLAPDIVVSFRAFDPDIVLIMNPFFNSENPIGCYALENGVRTVALIPSWDNITTKPKMLVRYDSYAVWSQEQMTQLNKVYGVPEKQIGIIGTPQYDVFFDDTYYQERGEFFAKIGLDPKKKLVVYALGSPNFIQEHHGIISFCEHITSKDLEYFQILIRPHPVHNTKDLTNFLLPVSEKIILRHSPNDSLDKQARIQDDDDIRIWVNTMRHADVLINLVSTVAIDAAFFDKPIVNLTYDPEPNATHDVLVKEINEQWSHFAPISKIGGIANVSSPREAVSAVRSYLNEPMRDSLGRQRMLDFVCQYTDGKCGERFSTYILTLLPEINCN